jgi:hypothetical protein
VLTEVWLLIRSAVVTALAVMLIKGLRGWLASWLQRRHNRGLDS